MASFRVNFFDPKGFFFPGEAVAGNITVSVQNEPINCRELRLTLRGQSYCRFTRGSGDKRRTYHNREDYFKEKVSLVSSGSSDEIQVSPGEYTYPFNFLLPGHIPPSFESKRGIGYVRYYLKVAFDLRMAIDIKEKIAFTIRAAPVDLNLTPHLLEPGNGSVDKYICCLCCKSGPIQIRCQINKQAFHSGEGLVFSCEVDNSATDTELNKIEGRLVEYVLLVSNMRSTRQHHSTVISSVIVSSGMKGRSEDSWQNIQLNIPADTLPSFENCKCVHLFYMFVLEVDIPSAIDAKVEFPITVANVIQSVQPTMMVQTPVTGAMQPPYATPYGAPPGVGQSLAYPPPPQLAAVTMQPASTGNWVTPEIAPPAYPGE